MKEFLEPELKIIAFEVEDILMNTDSIVDPDAPDIDPDTGLPIV